MSHHDLNGIDKLLILRDAHHRAIHHLAGYRIKRGPCPASCLIRSAPMRISMPLHR